MSQVEFPKKSYAAAHDFARALSSCVSDDDVSSVLNQDELGGWSFLEIARLFVDFIEKGHRPPQPEPQDPGTRYPALVGAMLGWLEQVKNTPSLYRDP